MTKSKIKAIVFDLDGTLYEDTHHFDFFAHCIEKKLPSEKKELFSKDYNLIINNNHPLQIGRIYDAKNDLILVQQDNHVIEAYDWNGNPIQKETIEQLYPHKISLKNKHMLNVGDLWWVPTSIARHHGLDSKQSHQAFLETRTYMMSEQFTMKPIQGLQQLLQSLYNYISIVLLTNSPEPDSEAILQKLGIHNLFHKKIFNGNKPISTEKWFKEIKAEFQIDFTEILSIGDNWLNEIKPASTLGCKTIFIDTHSVGNTTSADFVVMRMREGIPIIKELTKTL